MSELIIYVAILLFAFFVSSVSQVILKKESMKVHGSISQDYLNLNVIIAYILFIGTTFLAIFAYKVVPLSMGSILETTSYLWITIFGVIIFKERITKRRALALLLIIGGIIIFSACI